MASPRLALLGFGAIGQAVFQALRSLGAESVLHAVVVRSGRVDETQQQLGPHVHVATELPTDCDLLLECAGHEAVANLVPQALQRGVEVGIVSTGALADGRLAQALERAAQTGGTRLHLLAGAMGGIDALAAARGLGLTSVKYCGRKPPLAWKGTAAERLLNLDALIEPATFFSGCARDAVQQFPKNANVAATVALAGLGFNDTQVELIADPTIERNTHELFVQGGFGQMQLRLMIHPLQKNPKTSALTVWSAVNFIQSKRLPIVI